MNDFEKITLTKKEYKQLKTAGKRKITLHELPNSITLYRQQLIKHDFSEGENQYTISDTGKRYLVWHKKYTFKTYSPIIISCIALLLSLTSIILSVMGLM